MATTADQILTLERTALDRWGKGDPKGYLELYAPEVTYFDPTVAIRIDGLPALEEYYRPVAGTISIDRFEMLNPQVTVKGEMATLTYNLVDYVRGAIGSRWNCTEVFQYLAGDWKIIHSHWSLTQAAPREEIQAAD